MRSIIAIHYTILHYTALYCTTLHCKELHCTVLHYTAVYGTTLPYHSTVSVLGQDEGYTVKYSHTSEGVPEGEAQGNSQRRRAIIDGVSQVKALYGQYHNP